MTQTWQQVRNKNVDKKPKQNEYKEMKKDNFFEDELEYRCQNSDTTPARTDVRKEYKMLPKNLKPNWDGAILVGKGDRK